MNAQHVIRCHSRMRRALFAAALAIACAAAFGRRADGAEEAAPAPAPLPLERNTGRHPLLSPDQADRDVMLSFRDAPLDQVASYYAELTGRTLLEAPGLKASVSLRGMQRLTASEALEAIESALALHGIGIVPVGERFLKLVPLAGVGQEGLPIRFEGGEPAAESDRAQSQVFIFRHVDLAEIQPILQHIVRAQARVLPLERVNGVLITDTALNLRRAAELIEFLDQPSGSRVEVRVYELAFAKARDVASSLESLLQESATARPRPAPAIPTSPTPAAPGTPQTPPGVIRPPRAPTPAEPPADRGLLQGRVKIVPDERTNVLIVVTLPENFAFFDRIIAVLDRQAEPGVRFRVYPLEYAKAEEVASLLNGLVGAGAKAETAPAARAAAGEVRGRTLEELSAERNAPAREATAETELRDRLGALSSTTRILADKRTNTLLLMGPRADIAALEEVIRQLDIATAQVLIEAVVIEVRLSEGIEYGVDWLQRSLSVYNTRRTGPQGGVSVAEPVIAFGGGQRFTEIPFREGSTVGRNDPVLSVGGLSYYTTIYGLNMDLILRAVAASSNARVLSTPVIQSTDNTEAKIVVGEERPVVTSTSVSTGGQQTSAYQYRNIGLELTVTPRINPEGVVVMEVAQTADNLGGFEVIDGNRVPVITKRELKATIIAPHRATIALGGLVNTDRRLTRRKVPLLGDLPLLGLLFRSDQWEDSRTELLVLLTPYVLVSPEEARREARRLYEAGATARAGWERGWSDSELAAPPQGRSSAPAVRVLRRQLQTSDDPVKTQAETPSDPLARPTEIQNPDSVEPPAQGSEAIESVQ